MSDYRKIWAESLTYKGLIIEDPDYHIWGSSPIWGDDGKVHVFAARIPVVTGFDTWWATSQIAHYAADRPEGPFSLVKVLLKPGQTPVGSWDCGTQHNPSIKRIDDTYVLSYHASMSTVDKRNRPSQLIGMMTAKSINGPWTKLGKILDPPTHRQVPLVPEDYNGGTDNPALIKHPDGRYHLYYRIKFPGMEGRNTYGVAMADNLQGPYDYHPARVVNNPGYIEDPYVFILDGTFYMLVTDNDNGGGGRWLRSADGLFFDYDDGVKAYKPLAAYVTADEFDTSTHYRSPNFERPQLLLKDGVPTHLYAPCGSNVNGGPGTACYLFELGDIS
ncbi:MAG: glycoside hydrolase family protein [Lentisphaeria bacterium]|nr:glycoside hydrolase family protein [Lentisphaeria bacterium]